MRLLRLGVLLLLLTCTACTDPKPDLSANIPPHKPWRLFDEDGNPVATGRFQILTGNTAVIPVGEKEPVTLKLDTVTGRTWRLRRLNILTQDNISFEACAWDELSNDLAAQIHARESLPPLPKTDPKKTTP